MGSALACVQSVVGMGVMCGWYVCTKELGEQSGSALPVPHSSDTTESSKDLARTTKAPQKAGRVTGGRHTGLPEAGRREETCM